MFQMKDLFTFGTNGCLTSINKAIFDEGKDLIDRLKKFENSTLKSSTQWGVSKLVCLIFFDGRGFFFDRKQDRGFQSWLVSKIVKMKLVELNLVVSFMM